MDLEEKEEAEDSMRELARTALTALKEAVGVDVEVSEKTTARHGKKMKSIIAMDMKRLITRKKPRIQMLQKRI